MEHHQDSALQGQHFFAPLLHLSKRLMLNMAGQSKQLVFNPAVSTMYLSVLH